MVDGNLRICLYRARPSEALLGPTAFDLPGDRDSRLAAFDGSSIERPTRRASTV